MFVTEGATVSKAWGNVVGHTEGRIPEDPFWKQTKKLENEKRGIPKKFN